MRIVAIYGESGTGKSTSALSFAHENAIEAIIDDGLLIKEGKKIAGTSAKFEKNVIKAVKRAIFHDDEHCLQVKNAIIDNKIQSLLVIGTSKKMIQKIVERLQLQEVNQFININEIRTNEEILLARYVRDMQGKHTMPLPKNEVEQNFFMRMIQKGRDIFSSKKEKIGETTIVSPDFHPQSIFIHQRVYDEVLLHTVSNFHLTRQIYRCQFNFTDHLPDIVVELALAAPVTYNIWNEVVSLQKDIQDAYYDMMQIKITSIHIHVKEIQR